MSAIRPARVFSVMCVLLFSGRFQDVLGDGVGLVDIVHYEPAGFARRLDAHAPNTRQTLKDGLVDRGLNAIKPKTDV